MPTYGPTPQGFIVKPLVQIVQDFEDGETSTIDPAMNTGAQTPLGQLNTIVGSALAEVWEGLQTCYNMQNRDDAEGPALDNIGDQTGDLRLAPKPSSVYCNCTLAAANSPYVAGTLVCNVNGDATRQFSNVYDVIVAVDGTVSVLMGSLADGPIEATSGSLTIITAPVTGWTAVTNPLDATPGALLETDPDYRERQREELAATGACTVDSIQANLEQVPGIVAAFVEQNTQDITDPITLLPPHSMQAIVWDGSSGGTNVTDTVIAQAIWDEKPAGTATVGTRTAMATDINGTLQPVNFTRSAVIPVYMAFTVTLAPTTVLATVAPLIKQAIVYLSLGFQADGVTPLNPGSPGKLSPGVTVTALVYRAAALISGILDVPNLALDITPSPTATANIPVAPTSIATLDTSRITVNGI